MKNIDRDDYRNYDEDLEGRCIINVCGWAVLCVAIAIGLLVLASCSRTTYVPVETVRTEYVNREVEKLVTDTINNTRVVYVKGDTVIDLRDRERVRRVELHDTLVVERNDTIREPYPVERRLSRWEQTKMDLGGIALGVLVVAIIWVAVWMVRAYKRIGTGHSKP